MSKVKSQVHLASLLLTILSITFHRLIKVGGGTPETGSNGHNLDTEGGCDQSGTDTLNGSVHSHTQTERPWARTKLAKPLETYNSKPSLFD